MHSRLDFMKQAQQKREAVVAAEAAASEAQKAKVHELELQARREHLKEQMRTKDLDSAEATSTLANRAFATKVLHALIPALVFTKVIKGLDDPQLRPGPEALTAHQALAKLCQSRYVKLIEDEQNPLQNKEIMRMEADPLVGNILRLSRRMLLNDMDALQEAIESDSRLCSGLLPLGCHRIWLHP
jgi:hypothetical protein